MNVKDWRNGLILHRNRRIKNDFLYAYPSVTIKFIPLIK